MLPAVNTRPSSHPDRLDRPGLAGVVLRYPVMPRFEDWVIPEGTVSESVPHNEAARTLELVLAGWATRRAEPVAIARNLAIRFYEDRPQLGIDPDVCVLMPPPPGFEELSSLCLWKPGHVAPPLSIEVVSRTHPNKDYTTIQDRYAAMGGQEVVIFDPLLAGPHAFGGPVPLQLWRRDAMGLLERTHFGQGPAFSEVLGAWFVPDGRCLAIADDREGQGRWQTNEERAHAEKEHERAEKERERAEKERERAQRLELERRLAALEAKG
jgi:hypothetical protein